MIKRFLASRRRVASAAAAVPDGVRVYAIGDVHGRLDLLNQLLGLIASDDARRAPVERSILILLGDLVDRGPDSAGVVARLLDVSCTRVDTRFILGNHEEIFLQALDGDLKAARVFCRIGGRETLISYGMDPVEYESLDYDGIVDRMIARVPEEHVRFIRGFEDMVTVGDYTFVHAGVMPGQALDAQRAEHLRWIREPFLSHRAEYGRMVVHGHTISESIEHRSNRIGIDTGAYETGRLSAVVLEGENVDFLQT